MARKVLIRRSFVKALTYRVVIMSLDFGTVLIFTSALRIAIGFMIASNLYTTVAYLLHERIWSRVTWGIDEND